MQRRANKPGPPYESRKNMVPHPSPLLGEGWDEPIRLECNSSLPPNRRFLFVTAEWPTTRELHCLADDKLTAVNRSIALFLLLATVGTLAFADVCVYKPPKVRHVAGAVVDSSGRPIPGVSIAIIQDGISVASAKTNDAGEFRFDSLKEGSFELSATAPGFVSARYKVLLRHPTTRWNRSLQIELAVGLVHCSAAIRIVKAK
jgi:hypothetical protein